MRFGKVWRFAPTIALAIIFSGCEKTPEQKLIKGIKNNDVLMVQQALSEDVKFPEAKDGNGRSAAALLEEKKNAQISGMVNDYIKYNTIALGKAKTEEEAKRLMTKGVSKGIVSSDSDSSALHVAVKNRNVAMVKYLVANGFEVDLRRIAPPLSTPLACAIRTDDVEMAKLLISLGASFKLLNDYAQELIPEYNRHEYSEASYKKLIRRTETIVKIGWCDPTKIYQHSNVTKIELSKRNHGLYPDYDCTGKDFVLSLINMGMSPNTRNRAGKTPFAYAFEYDDDWANFLIAKGADINDCLAMAVEARNCENQIKWIKRLLDKGADPNTRIGDTTALGVALKAENGEIAKLLLNKGADPKTRIDGESALGYALKRNRVGMVKLLLDKGADPNTRVDGAPALSYALKIERDSDHTEIVKLLLNKGADPNTRVDGEPALSYALKNGHGRYEDKYTAEIVKFLLDKGADPNTRVEDKTALGYVIVFIIHECSVILSHKSSHDWLPVVELLLEKGADPNTKIDGYTALRYVMNYFASENGIKYGNFETKEKNDAAREIADLLRRHGAR